MNSFPQIILASASPRRAELLDQINVKYITQAVDIDESSREGESPEALVQRLAIEKSQAITSNQSNDLPVLGADTLGDEILSAVALSYKGRTLCKLNRNKVLFRQLSAIEIREYWETGEPQDKAGAYAVQGLAAAFIERIEGSYSGIMGLPLFETVDLLNNIKEK